MTSSNEEQSSLITLAQFQAALQNYLDFAYLKNIVDQAENVNCQIPDSDQIRSQKPELVGSTLLHLARRKSNFEFFKYLLDRGIDFTIKNKNGSTALLQPIENIDSKNTFVLTEIFNNKYTDAILSTHVRRNIPNNPRNNHGISHFHVACMSSNVAAVEFFLRNGEVSVDQPINANSPILSGYSPLHLAVASSSLQTVDTLLRYGANVNCKDSRGTTPLHILIKRRLDIVKLKVSSETERIDLLRGLTGIDEKMRLLLKHQASFVIDDTGLTDLHVACILPTTPTIEQQVAGIRDVNFTVRMDSPFFPGYTALHFAILFESPLVIALLRKGANIAAKDALGATPLDILLESNDVDRIHWVLSSAPGLSDVLMTDGRTRLLDLIIAMRDEKTFTSFIDRRRLDVNVHVLANSPLFPNFSVLHLAVLFAPDDATRRSDGGLGVVKACLAANASPYARDFHDSTPLHLAFRLRRVVAVDLLLELPVWTSAVDKDQLSTLHIAMAANDVGLVEKLLTPGNIDSPVRSSFEWFDNQHDSVVKTKDDAFLIHAGSTPLHIAVAAESLAMTQLLLRRGANVYAADAYGLTPIHRVLAADTYKKIGELLLSRANLEERVVGNGIDLSHLHVACFLNTAFAIERLLDLGADVEAAVGCPSPAFSFLAHLEGFTPIHVAMREENYEALRLLLDRGADILAKLSDGSTPFYQYLINRPTFFLMFFSHELRGRVEVLKRIQEDIGLTTLHIACYQLDLDLVEESLQSGLDVNCRVRLNSPIWPDYTPLHLLIIGCKKVIDSGHVDEALVCGVLGLLLVNGAYVLTLDVRGDSPLHLVDEIISSADQKSRLSHKLSFMTTIVTDMLSCIKDFTVNPKNKAGISLFHVACRVCDVATMRQLLDKGCDVNERIDGSLLNDRFGGYAPLHLSMSCPLVDDRKLEAVELLLNYGADCQAKTVFGDAPIHTAARRNDGPLRLNLIQRFVKRGANMNSRNFLDETPFEIVLKSEKISTEEITFFLTCGFHINMYNSVTESGYSTLAFNKECYDSHQDQEKVLDILLNNCNIHKTDQGRSAMHNIVSTKKPGISRNDYVTLINKLMKSGCQLDGQDDKGRTALHSAVLFGNHKAVEALLVAGIDVNIVDAVDRSAASCSTTDPFSFSCSSLSRNVAFYIYKLRRLNLDVIQQNINFQRRVYRDNPVDDCRRLRFSVEIMESRSVDIGSTSVSLRSFLSETGIVAAYPTVPLILREKIDRFFETDSDVLRKRLPELEGLLRLQHRKAMKRRENMDSAISSLQDLYMEMKGVNAEKDLKKLIINKTQFLVAKKPSIILPTPCCETILKYLTNMEIGNLIASTENFKTRL